MTGIENKSDGPRKHRQRGKNRRIGFSEEVVTKNVAESLLAYESRKLFADSNIKNLKKNLRIQANELSDGNYILEKESEQTTIRNKKGNKRNMKPQNNNIPSIPKKPKLTDPEHNVKDIEKTEDIKEPSSLSKRAIKKMKHQHLLEEKKKQLDEKLKLGAFNYLSNWKHNKLNWKFEKLKQIWLLQNLYDSNKIEESVWSIVVEYFSNSKGKVHKTILDEAIKIVENEKVAIDNNEEIKLNRARDLIQNLQD